MHPKAYLKKLGITDLRDTNQIANYALVEWSDNINIREAPPAEYFPKLIEDRKIAGDELQKMCYWHALPDGWETMSYDEFLTVRRKAMAQVIRDGFKALAGK